MPSILERLPHRMQTSGNIYKPPVSDETTFADDDWEPHAKVGMVAIEGYLTDPSYAEKVDAKQIRGDELLLLGTLAAEAAVVEPVS